MVNAARAWVLLAQNDLTTAANWVADREINQQISVSPREASYPEATYPEDLVQVQIYLALQRNVDALNLLAVLIAQEEQLQSIWRLAPLLALQVAALQDSGEFEQAEQVALRLLQLAEPQDYMRVYLDAGMSMDQVLQRLLNISHAQSEHAASPHILASIKLLLTAFEQEKQHAHAVQSAPTSPQLTASSLVEPLTAREQEVLRLMAQGMTNRDIADQLVVSLATAKKHVANILDKLGVENRTQAIARARECKLL